MIKTFIEKAKQGGYGGYERPFCIKCGGYEGINGIDMFLDPKAWEAVGKVKKNWIEESSVYNQEVAWKEKQLQFIKNLQQGEPIEEALTNVMK